MLLNMMSTEWIRQDVREPLLNGTVYSVVSFYQFQNVPFSCQASYMGNIVDVDSKRPIRGAQRYDY